MDAIFSEGGMATSQSPYSGLLRDLGGLMVAVAGESVTMVKRSAPEQALKLKKTDEWKLYLEFLKLMFNLADRLSALYVPIHEQPPFMESLERTVARQLRTVLEPALSQDSDEMEIVYTIGRAVAESRERYERFRFLITEESKARKELFKTFSERVAQMMGAPGNGMVVSATALCANSVVPAMTALFEEATKGSGTAQQAAGGGTGNEIKLISVMSSVEGEEVETRWGLHPRFRQDLRPDEAQELTRRMNRVTQILGERYAKVAFSADWKSWNVSGRA